MDLSEALTADMREPWQRDWTLGILAQHPDDLMEWTARLAYHYGEAGTLEVTAAIWALRAEIQRLRSAAEAVTSS